MKTRATFLLRILLLSVFASLSFVVNAFACTYVSSVETWSACSDFGQSYAVVVTYSTSTDTAQCVDVPLFSNCAPSDQCSFQGWTPLENEFSSSDDKLNGVDDDNDDSIDEGGFSCQNKEYFEISGRKYCIDYRPNGTTQDPNVINNLNARCAENPGWKIASYLDGESALDIKEIVLKLRSVSEDIKRNYTPPSIANQNGYFIGDDCQAVRDKFWNVLTPDDRGPLFSDAGCGTLTCGDKLYHYYNSQDTTYTSVLSCQFALNDGWLPQAGAVCEFDVNNCSISNNPSLTCSVSPSSPTVNQLVTWSATSTGLTEPISYSWTGDDFVQGKTDWYFSGQYNSTGTKSARVTVTPSTGSPISVDCLGTVTLDTDTNSSCTAGGCSGGVLVLDENKNGECPVGIIYSENQPTAQCVSGTAGPVSGLPNGRWSWTCSGNGVSDTCTAYNSLDPNLTCTLSRTAPTTKNIRVNQVSTWSVSSSSCPNCSVVWEITEGTNTPYEVQGQSDLILDKLFSTVGLKTVKARLASSTTTGVYGPWCVATSTVAQEGGGVSEI